MDPVLLAAICLFAGLFAGGVAGWLIGSRPVADWRQRWLLRDGEARELDERFKAAIRDLAGASERAARADGLADELAQARADHAAAAEQQRHSHAAQLDALRDEHGRAMVAARSELTAKLDRTREDYDRQIEALRREQRELASELATLRQKAANFDEQKKLLIDAREELLTQFRAAGGEVLSSAQQAFLKRAEERFAESEKVQAERLSSLLSPVGERLKSYEDQVANLEKQRVDAFGHLTGLIQSMREGQEAVRVEAMRLGNALTNAPKARGRWGEQQLRNLLESCGLSQHTDFLMEHSIDTADGRLRPDAIVRIPGGKVLVIDAKVSLNAYQEAFHADTEDARILALDAHVRSMKNHVQQLGAKSYQSQFEDAPDYVVMFVPGEHFVAAALERDPELWDFAFRNRVLLATPTNLVAIARTVAQVWRQDALAQEAREIGRLGTELYDRIALVGEHLKRVGSGLDSAVSNYNKFVGSFERNVTTSARRLRDKGIEIGKREVEEIPLVETTPRYADAAPGPDLLEDARVLAPVDGDASAGSA